MMVFFRNKNRGHVVNILKRPFGLYLETVMKMLFWIDLDLKVMLPDWLLVACK